MGIKIPTSWGSFNLIGSDDKYKNVYKALYIDYKMLVNLVQL